MSIRVYIVTYKRNDVLNKNLKTLWATACAPEKLDVTVLANHPDVQIDYENQRPNLRVKLNETRPTNAWGYLSRDWNFSLLDAFGTWENPRGTDWAVLAQNDVEWLDGWDNFLRNEDRFDLITQAAGDQSLAFTINAVRKVGFFDERFCTLHYQEFDYFQRAIIALLDRVSVNDNHKSLNPADHSETSWNPIGEVLTKLTGQGCVEQDNLHTFRTWHEMHNLLLAKWQVSDVSMTTDRPRWARHIAASGYQPTEVDWYPFFWDKMPNRQHRLLESYVTQPAPPAPVAPPAPAKTWLRRWQRRVVDATVRRCYPHFQRAMKWPAVANGAPPTFTTELHTPPQTPQRQSAGLRVFGDSAGGDVSCSAPSDNANRILAVVQGPFFRQLGSRSTYDVLQRFRDTPYGSRISLAAAVWDTELPADIRQIGRVVDHLHVFTPPQRKGTSFRNWQSHAIDGVLEAHQHDGYAYALKCRSDMLVTDRFFEHAFQRMEEGSDRLCVTNQFTLREPFHVSDMLVFSRYDNLRKYFGNYETFYEDIFAPEVEFTRRYIRAKQLPYYHTTEDYLRFLAEQVDIVDFNEMGIVWLKNPHISTNECYYLKAVMLDRDSGPINATPISKDYHERLLKMSPRELRYAALKIKLFDPVLRYILLRHDFLEPNTYHVYRDPEYARPLAKLPHPAQSAAAQAPPELRSVA